MQVSIETAGRAMTARIKLPRRVVITVLTATLSSGGGILYHAVDTRIELKAVRLANDDCQKRLKRIESELAPVMPGQISGSGAGSGAPHE
jgi:hypothetical protein